MVVDSYIIIIMLRIGGAETHSLPLMPPPPMQTPSKEVQDTTDGLSVTTNNRMDSYNNVTASTVTKPGTVLQSTVGHSVASDQTPPTWTFGYKLKFIDTYVVGPVIYMHLSTANSSDAGFAVDLLFRHHAYAKASHRFVVLKS